MANLPTTANVANPQQMGYDAALGDLLLRLARRPQDPALLESAEPTAQRVQTERTSEDFLPAVGAVFSRNDFRGGSGLDFAYKPDSEPSDVRRYWRASAIEPVNVTGAPERIELARDVESLWTLEGSGSIVYTPQGEIMWQKQPGGDSTVWVVDDPFGVSPTRASEDPHTGTSFLGFKSGLAALGSEVFASCRADGIGKRDSSGVWSDLPFGTAGCESIWAAKGRLIGQVYDVITNQLVAEIDPATGDRTTLLALGDQFSKASDVIEAGPVILISTYRWVASFSNKYYEPGPVYVFGEEAGQLVLLSQFELPATESVHSMAYLAGRLLIVTIEQGPPVGGGRKGRVWVGSLGSPGAGYIPDDLDLRHEFVQSSSLTRNTVAATGRDRIYYAYDSIAGDPLGEGAQVWYYDVTQDAIIHAATHTNTGGAPAGLVVVADNRYWLTTQSGVGIVARSLDTRASSGWLISPMADFFNPTIKTWLDVIIEGDEGDGTVAAYVSNDLAALEDYQHSSWSLVGTIPTDSNMGEKITLDLATNLTGRYGAVQLRLTKGTTTDPIVYSFALRAENRGEDFVLTLPVNVSDQIERSMRRPFRVSGWGERMLAAVRAKRGDFLTVDVYRPSITMEGVVEKVSEPYVGRTARGSLSLISDVQVRGRLV